MRLSPDNNLAAKRPDLVSEWDYEANGDLRPQGVTPGSNQRVGWVCVEGHRWQAKISSRSRGTGCPRCVVKSVGGGRPASPDNNLAVKRPDLVSEWDHEANADLRPEDVTPGSDKKVAWVCVEGHRWRARVSNRSRSKGGGCPACAVHRADPDNNLAVKRPDLAAEWDRETNGTLPPQGVTPGSHKKVGWICSKGHRWLAAVANRSNGRGCPECSGQRAGADNNLAVKRPDLASEWDYEANGDLRPQGVTPGSNKRVNWVCAKGHRWEARVSDRSRGTGCPRCAAKSVGRGRPASPDNNLAVKRPDLASEWDYEANGTLQPEDVTPGVGKKVAWVCVKGHRWQAKISNRSRGTRCPVCRRPSRIT